MVCYDTPNAGRHAKEMLDRLQVHFGNEIVFDVRLWRYDLIESPEAYEQARRDAAGASLFAAAYAGSGSPQVGFKRLVANWASEHGTAGAALVALPAGPQINRSLVRTLRLAAEQHGVRFLFSGDSEHFPEELIGCSRPNGCAFHTRPGQDWSQDHDLPPAFN